jgi:hypothetical protein
MRCWCEFVNGVVVSINFISAGWANSGMGAKSMELEFFKVLGAGGDLATIAVFFALWKFDRRLFRLELKIGGKSA